MNFQLGDLEREESIFCEPENSEYSYRSESNNKTTRNSLTSLSNGFLHPNEIPTRPKSANASNKTTGVMGLFRRNTAELAATIRERYQGHRSESATDRPDTEQRGETPPPTPNEEFKLQKTARSHSVKGSFIRRFAKATTKERKDLRIDNTQVTVDIERSRSYQSQISEEGEIYCICSKRGNIAKIATQIMNCLYLSCPVS